MPVGLGSKWLILLVAMLLAGCDSICSNCAASDKGIAASNTESQGPTVEVHGYSPDTKDFTPTLVIVTVRQGDLTVIATGSDRLGDSNNVFVAADGVMLGDNIAEGKLISKTVEFRADNIEYISVGPGEGVTARMNTHVYVRPNVPLNITVIDGNVHLAGSVGQVTAVAQNGSIDARGTTQSLDLTVHGKDRGIVVDGAQQQLNLHADNGPIEITAWQVNVTATTGLDPNTGGSIFFAGSLLPGKNTFTTTNASNITIAMPQNDAYNITAKTDKSTIDVQFPTSGTLGTPVCGTFIAGKPYVIRVDDHDHHSRSQLTFNMGDVRSAGPVELRGVVTSQYFVFDSTARNFLAEVPNISELFLQTLNGVLVDAQPVTTTSQVTVTGNYQVDTFTGVAAIQPSGANAAPAPASIPTTQQSMPMRPVHCPPTVPWPPTKIDIAIIATSNGGHIRIYQNLP